MGDGIVEAFKVQLLKRLGLHELIYIRERLLAYEYLPALCFPADPSFPDLSFPEGPTSFLFDETFACIPTVTTEIVNHIVYCNL
jgi:hypothetical protein